MEFLTQINDILTNQLGEFGPLIAVGGLGLFMILLVIPLMMKQPEDPMKKLQRNMASERQRGAKSTKDQLRHAGANQKLEKFANFLEPQDAEDLSAMQLKLRQAGYHSKDAVRFFHFVQMLLGILGLMGGAVYIWVLSNNGQEVDQQTILKFVIGPGGVGYFLPKYWVTRRVEARKEEITAGFPDALDMMLVCVEAGQSLDQSIVRVAGELKNSYPAMGEEFEVVAYEMKAGKEKSAVLRDMGDRCGVQDVSSFVTVLIQSATFGTSIADALRVYSSEMRDKRVMRAEEAANKLPTKMTLATMMLTVPPLLVILVGPSANGISNLGTMGN